MAPKLTEQAVEFIASFEGYRAAAYNDGADPPNATIGYGHELHAGPVTGEDAKLYWTREQALAQLRRDVARAEQTVRELVHVRLGLVPARADARFGMLVSLCFNIGGGSLCKSTLIREVNRKGAPRDWRAVVPYWLEWVYAGSVRLEGLERRRRAEVVNFLAGKITTY